MWNHRNEAEIYVMLHVCHGVKAQRFLNAAASPTTMWPLSINVLLLCSSLYHRQLGPAVWLYNERTTVLSSQNHFMLLLVEDCQAVFLFFYSHGNKCPRTSKKILNITGARAWLMRSFIKTVFSKELMLCSNLQKHSGLWGWRRLICHCLQPNNQMKILREFHGWETLGVLGYW